MKRRSVALLAACLVVGLLVPGALSPYDQYVGVTILLYGVIAQAWNIIGGYSGQLSLGSAAFVGVGGYSAGLLMLHQGVGWAEATLAATVVSGVFAFVLGFPLLRLRGPYFAVGTLAASVGFQTAAQLWGWAGGGTGFVLPGGLPSSVTLFRAAAVAFVVAIAVVLYLRGSAFGLRVVAVRDDESAAAGVGISAFRHRMAAFVLSSALTGLAGALIALQSITVSPGGMFDVNFTINAILYVVVGGIATFFGPIIGVALVYGVLTQQLQRFQAVSTLVEGGLLLVIVRFGPEGLWPLLTGWAKRSNWFGRGSAADESPQPAVSQREGLPAAAPSRPPA